MIHSQHQKSDVKEIYVWREIDVEREIDDVNGIGDMRVSDDRGNLWDSLIWVYGFNIWRSRVRRYLGI